MCCDWSIAFVVVNGSSESCSVCASINTGMAVMAVKTAVVVVAIHSSILLPLMLDQNNQVVMVDHLVDHLVTHLGVGI